jgi:hypothetical protein
MPRVWRALLLKHRFSRAPENYIEPIWYLKERTKGTKDDIHKQFNGSRVGIIEPGASQFCDEYKYLERIMFLITDNLEIHTLKVKI